MSETSITDQELLDRAKRMLLTLKGVRMGMPGVEQTFVIPTKKGERLVALAMLGAKVLETWQEQPEDLPRAATLFLDDLIKDWLKETVLLVGEIIEDKGHEKV